MMYRRVFFVGAGISRADPSRLPSSEDIAFRLADEITEPEALRGYRERVRIAASSLRLELLLDLIVRELGSGVVERLFRPFCDSTPNRNHFALAWLREPIITTNQDTLLEAAARRIGSRPQVRHLHGTCSHPRRIAARLSEFVRGFDEKTRKEVHAILADRDVVVLGYSGRDIDVMQCLLAASPRSVTWIARTHRRQGPDVATLARLLGRRFRRVTSSAEDYLLGLVPPTVWADVPPSPGGPWRRPTASLIGQPRRVSRGLALSAILERYGDAAGAEEAVRGAGRHGPSVLLRLGRLALQRDDDDAALAFYTRADGRGGKTTIQSLRGQIEALRKTSRYQEAYATLDRLDHFLARSPNTQRDRGWAENARAGLLRMEGRPSGAYRWYRAAEKSLQAIGDLDGMVEARTWLGETRLQIGDLERGIRDAESALQLTVDYGRWYPAGWPLYVIAEGLGYQGHFDAAQDRIAEALERFEQAQNLSGQTWTHLLAAASNRTARPDLAQLSLERARTGLALANARGVIWAHAEARFQLERAEMSRAVGDSDAVWSAVLMARAQSASIGRPPALELQLELIEASIGMRGERRTALRLVSRRFRRLGLVRAAAAAAVAGCLLDPEAAPPHELMRLCERRFPAEFARLRRPDRAYFPFYFA